MTEGTTEREAPPETPPAPTPAEQFAEAYDVEATEPNQEQAVPSETPETPAEEPPPQPVAYNHPNYLVQMAQDQGFSDEEIQSIPTDQLGQSVQHIQARVERSSAQRRVEEGRHEAMNRHPEPEPEPEAAVDFGMNLEESFTPELAKAIKVAANAQTKKIKELERRLAAQEQEKVAELTQTATQRFDAAIAKLGPGYEKILGKGTARQIQVANPAAYQAHQKPLGRAFGNSRLPAPTTSTSKMIWRR